MEPFDLRAAFARQRKNNRLGAARFVEACKSGDVEALIQAASFLHDETLDGWRLAMLKVGRLPAVSAEIRLAFLNVWIESKTLAAHIGSRRALADALRVLMPCDYRGTELRLYRGASWPERRRRRYGFSWTRDREIALSFAEPHAGIMPDIDREAEMRAREMARQWGGGVVLETIAPPDAILLVREPEDYYDESEVVVDPFRLRGVTVAERLRP